MAASSILLLATAITLAVALEIAIGRVAHARLHDYLSRAPLRALRSSLAMEILGAASLLIAALALARRIAGEPDTTFAAPWTLAGIPASVAAVCAGLMIVRAPHRPDRTPGASDSLWITSAIGAGAITVLLILSRRIVPTDALLLIVGVPAWMWMLAGWRGPDSGSASPDPRPRPTSGSPPPSPGPRLLLLCVPLAGVLVLIVLSSPIALIADLLATGALLAMLAPLALAAASHHLDADRASWAAAPIYLIGAIVPLVGLTVAALAHVVLVVSREAALGARSGTPWHVAAGETLASMPYVTGLARLITPALLALTLPLLAVALAGVSSGVRRGAGAALILSGIAMAASGLAST